MNRQLEILKEILEFGYTTNDENLFWCPNCSHHKPKLSINVKKNKFHCWICPFKGSNVYYILKKYGNFTQQQEWLNLSGDVDISEFDSIFFDNNVEKIETKVELPKEFISLSNYGNIGTQELLKPFQYLFYERGITFNEIVRWKLGVCLDGFYKKRIICPSFDEKGNVNYFVARSYGDVWPDYQNPSISKTIIFNEMEIDWQEDVILVEGFFDSIKHDNSLPLLGNTLNENSQIFKKIVNNNSKTFIALDQDCFQKSVNLIQMLLEYNVQTYIVDTRGYKDIGVMPKEIFKQRKLESERITFDNIFNLILSGSC